MKRSITKASFWHALLVTLGLTIGGAASAAPVGLDFEGTLADGGTFSGFVVYGDFDVEGGSPGELGSPTDDIGRYLGGLWHVDVQGGLTTQSAVLDRTLGGRAPLETRESPLLIHVLVLGPSVDELPRLSLMFEAVPGYDADLQPTIADIAGFYFDLTVGSNTVSSGYTDANGIFSAVTGIQFADGTYHLNAVPLPGGLVLMAGALAILPGLRRPRRGS